MKKLLIYSISTILVILFSFYACKSGIKLPEEATSFVSEVKHAEWTKKMVLYEVNVRQFTKEGTFNAMTSHLPRLKDLGIDVLWFMPIHPIGELNRKGELGSYYSVRDFEDVNPEFGTLKDFKSLVDQIHALGMYVMIDWVPNHTSWDNLLITEHPDWYEKDSTGKFVSPYDWTDVVQLNWKNQELQAYMLDALKFWVELGVDGFRVDHPHKTPYEFWEKARPVLDKVRPVLLLAENEEQIDFMKKGFDMNYAWELHHLMNSIAQGKDSVKSLDRYFVKEAGIYPPNVYRMCFIDNHDENSWAGTINERLGIAQRSFAVFTFTAPDVPLLYNGQEACLDKRLKFFERDPIEWKDCELTGFYKTLIQMKKENMALWNGENGGPMKRINTGKDGNVFAFSREKDRNQVVVFLNLSDKALKIKPALESLAGDYRSVFGTSNVRLPLADSLSLEAWGYTVLVK